MKLRTIGRVPFDEPGFLVDPYIILETITRTANYHLDSAHSDVPYFEGLEKLGKTLRLASYTKRYFELKNKGDRLTEAEAKRLEKLLAYLQDNLENFEE
ncbi:MAG TPA: hypothetical protein DCF68_20195 [Cyanothece sp. UBA12306]|nr:hypothetical protein [Cyanothece sp. UBA12306]